MTLSLDLNDMAIVLATPQQDPTLLTPDFLRHSGITPDTWDLERPPVRSAQGSQIGYQNGVRAIAYPNRTVFTQPLRHSDPDAIEIAAVAQRYGEILRNLDYQAVGIHFRGHVPFNQDLNAAREYLFGTLLTPGPWQQMGTAPVRAGLNLVYTFEHKRLNLSVQEAALQLPEQQRIPIVMFSGNFAHDLKTVEGPQRLEQLQQIIGAWQADLQTYQDVVHQLLEPTSMPHGEPAPEALIPIPAPSL